MSENILNDNNLDSESVGVVVGVIVAVALFGLVFFFGLSASSSDLTSQTEGSFDLVDEDSLIIENTAQTGQNINTVNEIQVEEVEVLK